MPGQWDAKQFQHCRSYVDNRWIRIPDSVIAEKDSGHQPRIDTMITAPRLQIVLKNLAGDFAHHGIPRSAESIAVTHDQIRSIIDIRARIHGIAIEDASDADTP